jgi:hypothetical protein
MNETQWAKSVQELVNAKIAKQDSALSLRQGAELAYANEVLSYKENSPARQKEISYETDLLVVENADNDAWKPRVVIECKIQKVTTHDAITYSEKAFTHKRVHPYLRYGILLGNRAHYPLPGRLFRHGLYFDFMLSWSAESPTDKELKGLLEILIEEVEASRNLEEMLYNSRSATRNRYVVLHKSLRLKK